MREHSPLSSKYQTQAAPGREVSSRSRSAWAPLEKNSSTVSLDFSTKWVRRLLVSAQALVWALLVNWAIDVGVVAAESTASFDQSNKLYEEGKFREAAAGYRNLVREGKMSSALFFNLGNSLFKSGQMGRGIISYRLAEELSPRDPDIRANLQFARDTVGGASVRSKVLDRFLNIFNANELTVLVVFGIWVWFGLLTVKEFLPEPSRRSLGVYTKSAAAFCVVFGVWLAAVLDSRFGNLPAVVVAPEGVVRYGPFDESQSYYTLRDGAELSIVDRKDNWFQVKDNSGRTGWLRSEQVARIAPESVLDGS